MAAADKIQAYKDWVMSVTHEEFVGEYNPSLNRKTGKPIGRQRIHNGEYHCEQLDKLIKETLAAGGRVEVYIC